MNWSRPLAVVQTAVAIAFVVVGGLACNSSGSPASLEGGRSGVGDDGEGRGGSFGAGRSGTGGPDGATSGGSGGFGRGGDGAAGAAQGNDGSAGGDAGGAGGMDGSGPADGAVPDDGAADGRDGATSAALMTYDFTAHIYSVEKAPGLRDAPAVGAPVTGTLSFDPDPSHYPAHTTRYVQTLPGSGLFIHTGTWNFAPRSTSVTSIVIIEPRRPDRSGLFYASEYGGETWIEKKADGAYANILLADPYDTLSSGLPLPATFDFSKLSQSYFGGLIFGKRGKDTFEIKAIIDTFTRRD